MFISMKGMRYGRLVVIDDSGRSRRTRDGHARLLRKCRCDCGKEIFVGRQSLISGNTTSCGCGRSGKKTHGQTDTRLYRIWAAMMSRCNNPNTENWDHYGNRGIKVCERWHRFENFAIDMGQPPDDSMSLDRYPDNNGNYEPSNCRWATMREQCRNRRGNRILEFNGRKQCLSAWAQEIGISSKTITSRLRLGWTIERTLSEPQREILRSNDPPKRKSPSYSDRIAAVLQLLKRSDGSPLIPPHIAAQGAKAILRCVEWDHMTPVALGGSNEWHNIQPLSVEDHAKKTKRDVAAIAKAKRLEKKYQDFRRRILAKTDPNRPETGLKRPPIGVSVLGLVQVIDAQTAISGRPKRKIAVRANPWPRGRKFPKRRLPIADMGGRKGGG